MNSKLDKIKELAEQYDSKKNQADDKHVWERFNTLFNTYGIEAVAAATGLKTSSVQAYTNRSYIGKISESVVVKAETILAKI